MFYILNRSLPMFLVSAYLLIAQAQTVAAEPETVPADILLETMSPFQENYIFKLLQIIRKNGHGDLALDEKSIMLSDRIEQTNRRAGNIRDIFRYDLNGDGIVTKKEILLLSSVENRTRRRTRLFKSKLVKRYMGFDLNKDGQLTFEEVLKVSGKNAKRLGHITRRIDTLKKLLALDTNGDQRLTLNELKKLGLAAFAKFDKDGNGTLTGEEFKAFSKVRSKASQRNRKSLRKRNQLQRLIERCVMPKVHSSDEIFVVSSYEAGRLSNISVAGANKATETSNIFIEAGEKPLYVIVNAFTPMIWNFTGHVERVKNIVALGRSRQGSTPAVGIIGIPKDRVTFLPSRTCFGFTSNPKSGKARLAKAHLKAIFGRPINKMIAHYSLSGVDLPSGKKHTHAKGSNKRVGFLLDDTDNTSQNVDRATIRELLRFSPDGVARLDLEKVVSPNKTIAYEVLPQQAGLIQLMKEGKLERLSDGMYLIKKPIPHFPAGLAGAHSVKFLLGKGVPMPKGRPGHSSVISEESGKRLK